MLCGTGSVEPGLYVGVAVAAITSLWLVPLYYIEKRAAEERFTRVLGEVERAQNGVSVVLQALGVTVNERGEYVVPERPAPGLFAGGGIDPREARGVRDEKEAERLMLEANLVERLGPQVVAGIKLAFPDLWRKALKQGDGALAVLEPLARSISIRTKDKQAPGNGAGPW